MFVKKEGNAFDFANGRPTPLLCRTADRFWHTVEEGDQLPLSDGEGTAIQYSDGTNSWYPLHLPNLFQEVSPEENDSEQQLELGMSEEPAPLPEVEDTTKSTAKKMGGK